MAERNPDAVSEAFAVRGLRTVVTGAGGFIGREVARVFARNGARVVCSDLAGQRLADAVRLLREQGSEAHERPADLASPESLEGLVAGAVSDLGGLDAIAHWTRRHLNPPWQEEVCRRSIALERDAGTLEQPLRLCGTPLDVAMACVYLCSPAARFVTGADLVVDGGKLQEMPRHEPRFRDRHRDPRRQELRDYLEALPAEAWCGEGRPRWLNRL
jgi:NAD(P)-dependent dehydrogenase (short-subunit alcohol dehydrogenase family)